jgi:hypothetical protein
MTRYVRRARIRDCNDLCREGGRDRTSKGGRGTEGGGETSSV